MFDIVFTRAERALLLALDALGVPYLVVGMSAALIEGAPGTTQDLDLWFGDLDAEKMRAPDQGAAPRARRRQQALGESTQGSCADSHARGRAGGTACARGPVYIVRSAQRGTPGRPGAVPPKTRSSPITYDNRASRSPRVDFRNGGATMYLVAIEVVRRATFGRSMS